MDPISRLRSCLWLTNATLIVSCTCIQTQALRYAIAHDMQLHNHGNYFIDTKPWIPNIVFLFISVSYLSTLYGFSYTVPVI